MNIHFSFLFYIQTSTYQTSFRVFVYVFVLIFFSFVILFV